MAVTAIEDTVERWGPRHLEFRVRGRWQGLYGGAMYFGVS